MLLHTLEIADMVRKRKERPENGEACTSGQPAQETPEKHEGVSLKPLEETAVKHKQTAGTSCPPCAGGDGRPQAAEAEATEDDAPDDQLCPLCHELLHEPLRTLCGHVYCALCLQRVFEVRKASDAPGLQPGQRGRDCPLCRAPLRLADSLPAADMAARIAEQRPAAAARRAAESAAERQQLAARAVLVRSVEVGNAHALRAEAGATGNTHDWVSVWIE